jgi:hypothetical protein
MASKGFLVVTNKLKLSGLMHKKSVNQLMGAAKPGLVTATASASLLIIFSWLCTVSKADVCIAVPVLSSKVHRMLPVLPLAGFVRRQTKYNPLFTQPCIASH